MNQQTILIIASAAIVLLFCVRIIEKAWRSAMGLVEAIKVCAAELPKLSSVVVTNQESIAALPKLVSGLAEVCREQTKHLDKFQESVDLFSTSLFGKGTLPTSEQNPDIADREYEILQLQKTNGLSEAEARARVNEKSMWMTLGDKWKVGE